MTLPRVIDDYVRASNAHDVESILACFSDDAAVHDEEQTRRGRTAIREWIMSTIAKYKFQFKPLKAQDGEGETVVAVEVSGTFPGSPVILDYYFTIEGDKIASLAIS